MDMGRVAVRDRNSTRTTDTYRALARHGDDPLSVPWHKV